ncbi:MAG: tol-pal system protein YbgF [Cyclobacteriaceae bacterium]
MRWIKIFVTFLSIGVSTSINAQWSGQLDTTSNILLQNRYVEIEATMAMFNMYNMEFDKAESHFNYLIKQYGWHPLPYFLMGLSHWWRLMPYGEMETKWDDRFLNYMDTAERLSKRLYEQVHELEGAFFLSAVYAFRGRFYGDRGDYIKASFEGKGALKYLEICRGNEDFSPELLFGDALFNYYAEWIPEHYPMLKPLLAFFPDGDKKLGLDQLEQTARNAFYARTEAQYYLMRILYAEENDVKSSFQLADYLHKQYPNNAYFHRFYARLLYQMGKNDEAIKESKLIIERIDLQMDGYEYNSGRYAAFFLGHINERLRNYEESKKYFKYAMEYGELSESTDKGYYFFAILHLGRIAEIEEDYASAIDYYQQVKRVTKRKQGANKEARRKISELKKKS